MLRNHDHMAGLPVIRLHVHNRMHFTQNLSLMTHRSRTVYAIKAKVVAGLMLKWFIFFLIHSLPSFRFFFYLSDRVHVFEQPLLTKNVKKKSLDLLNQCEFIAPDCLPKEYVLTNFLFGQLFFLHFDYVFVNFEKFVKQFDIYESSIGLHKSCYFIKKPLESCYLMRENAIIGSNSLPQ